jgi:hypothetical protein
VIDQADVSVRAGRFGVRSPFACSDGGGMFGLADIALFVDPFNEGCS